jgi:hypothetical protein
MLCAHFQAVHDVKCTASNHTMLWHNSMQSSLIRQCKSIQAICQRG